MTLKGRIQPDHIPLNKYTLNVVGLPAIDFISVSGLETEIDTVELPDRTVATGGQTGTSEITVVVPSHHEAQITAMEVWLQEGQDPVTISYKKAAVLTQLSGSGGKTRSWTLTGVFVSKRSISDMAFENEGEMSGVEYTLKVDDISPLGLPL